MSHLLAIPSTTAGHRAKPRLKGKGILPLLGQPQSHPPRGCAARTGGICGYFSNLPEPFFFYLQGVEILKFTLVVFV